MSDSFNRKTPDYWSKRSEWIMNNGMKDTDLINRKIQKGYVDVFSDISRDLADFMTVNKTVQDINKPVSIKEYLQSMDGLFKKYDQAKTKYTNYEPVQKRIMNQINSMNARYKRTRLEVLKEQTKARLDLYGIKAHGTMMEGLEKVYQNTFDRKHYTLARGLGYGWQYDTPPWKTVEETILYPWAKDGSMFSERIWEMTDNQANRFIHDVRRNIASGAVAQGKHPTTIAKNIVGFGNPKLSQQRIKANASRLLYTEATHVIEEASAKVSEDWGITHYVYLSTLDRRTSSACQALDGRRFFYKKRQAGTNFPPMHPNCRSTHYDDIEDNLYTERASRGANGATVHEVPHYATYKQWKTFQETGKKTWRKPRRKTYQKTTTPPKVIPTKKVPTPPTMKERIQAVKDKITKRNGVIQETDLMEAGKIVKEEHQAKRIATKQKLDQLKDKYKATGVDEKIKELTQRENDLKMARRNLKTLEEVGLKDKAELYTEMGKISREKDQLVRSVWDLKDEISDLELKYMGDEFENAKELKDLLSEIRPMGSKGVNVTSHLSNSRSVMRKDVEKAFDHYPTEWVQKSADKGKLKVKKVQRGYYDGRTIAISGQSGTERTFETSLHELGHRFETSVPEILDSEKEFYSRRTNGENLQWLGYPYARSERTRFDNFLDRYMGKDYGGRAYELVSMGFQYAYTHPTKLWTDEDMADWIYGILALK